MADSVATLLQTAMRRHLSAGEVTGCTRLTGGATMESWRFDFAGSSYVLRRAPTPEFMADRPFGHRTEAAIISAAYNAGVTAPEVVAVLDSNDGLNSGFIMRALSGTPNPREILAMDNAGGLLAEAARDLARIHAIARDDVPANVPVLNYAEGVAGLHAQFKEAGADRPVIALGLKWLSDNLPEPVEPVLNHGDFRLGNLLAKDSQLTGVLDWELAHFGDRHEDLAFGCMAVWRFARYDRPALGLGSLEEYFAAYEAESGHSIDRDRFRFWQIYRTVWWALGCLRMAKIWRSGEDRMLERVVISRRTSEQELDLLVLLEEEAPAEERAKPVDPYNSVSHPIYRGEADQSEILIAVSEWLTTIAPQLSEHDQFQLAVARRALKMVRGEEAYMPDYYRNRKIAGEFLDGTRTLQMPAQLGLLRYTVQEKICADSPKYPALLAAKQRWGVDEPEFE